MLDTFPRYWHDPIIARSACGHANDRERLGLPDRYVASRYSDSYARAYDALRVCNQSTLQKKCQDAAVPLLERLVAGNLLAVLGDPRICTMNPPMVAVSGGVIEVGLDPDDVDAVLTNFTGLGLERQWIEKECPRYTIEIASFAIGRYPVTNLEYRDFLLDSGFAELPTSWSFRRFPVERANHPVYTISAEAADAYCAWLSSRTGRQFRLPREAEWEYAAAGPEGLEFPWGDTFGLDRANTAETGLFDTSPVGIFVEGNTAGGVADLAGNVEEYVAEDYAPYPGGARISDHLTQIHASYRIARGGSFARFRDLARARRRHGHNPRSVVYAMGFRLAESSGQG